MQLRHERARVPAQRRGDDRQPELQQLERVRARSIVRPAESSRRRSPEAARVRERVAQPPADEQARDRRALSRSLPSASLRRCAQNSPVSRTTARSPRGKRLAGPRREQCVALCQRRACGAARGEDVVRGRRRHEGPRRSGNEPSSAVRPSTECRDARDALAPQSIAQHDALEDAAEDHGPARGRPGRHVIGGGPGRGCRAVAPAAPRDDRRDRARARCARVARPTAARPPPAACAGTRAAPRPRAREPGVLALRLLARRAPEGRSLPGRRESGRRHRCQRRARICGPTRRVATLTAYSVPVGNRARRRARRSVARETRIDRTPLIHCTLRLGCALALLAAAGCGFEPGRAPLAYALAPATRSAFAEDPAALARFEAQPPRRSGRRARRASKTRSGAHRVQRVPETESQGPDSIPRLVPLPLCRK